MSIKECSECRHMYCAGIKGVCTKCGRVPYMEEKTINECECSDCKYIEIDCEQYPCSDCTQMPNRENRWEAIVKK